LLARSSSEQVGEAQVGIPNLGNTNLLTKIQATTTKAMIKTSPIFNLP